MIVRRLRDLIGTDRDVLTERFNSRRFLLAGDGQSYSFHDTVIRAGLELELWYKNHVESVYCVSGDGEIVDVATGDAHPLNDGTFYCLDDHDKHILRANTDLRLICVFTPALVGPEVHDEDGAFPLLSDVPLSAEAAVAEASASIKRARRVSQRKGGRRNGRATTEHAQA